MIIYSQHLDDDRYFLFIIKQSLNCEKCIQHVKIFYFYYIKIQHKYTKFSHKWSLYMSIKIYKFINL